MVVEEAAEEEGGEDCAESDCFSDLEADTVALAVEVGAFLVIAGVVIAADATLSFGWHAFVRCASNAARNANGAMYGAMRMLAHA